MAGAGGHDDEHDALEPSPGGHVHLPPTYTGVSDEPPGKSGDHTDVVKGQFLNIVAIARVGARAQAFRAANHKDSENSTALPCPGVATSPSHITRFPRTIVPTGQPVTFTPS